MTAERLGVDREGASLRSANQQQEPLLKGESPMSTRPIKWLRSKQIVPQAGINPDVMESPAVPCVGGPCDGQQMRCPEGRILIVTNAVDGLRAVSLPAVVAGGNMVGLARKLSVPGGIGHVGHYERRDDVLHWMGDADAV
jgi:hypothetical protein